MEGIEQVAENKENNGELYVLQGTSDYFEGKINGSDKSEIFRKKLDLLKEKIREFLNLKNVYFLFGAGTSSEAIPTMKDLCEDLSFSGEDEDIKEGYNLIKDKVGDNLEVCLSVLYSGRAYYDGLIVKQEAQPKDQDREFERKLGIIKKIIEKIEKHIFDKLNVGFNDKGAETNLGYYKEFYQKLARRNRDNSRICVFTTNNDLLNETAMDSLSINYINGFSGGLRRFFNPAIFNYTWSKRMDTSIDKYEPTENMVYLYKLHGSINWRETKNIGNTYFEIEEVHPSDAKADGSVLIYPTPTKQDKSLGSPYVDLFREFQNKLLEPHSVLFIIGYSFSDRHVNDIIYRALATNSSLNVVIFGKKPNAEDEKRLPIFFANDSRIFTIYGKEFIIEKAKQEEDQSSKNKNRIINHFDYIVKELLPNIDAYSKEDEMLKKFISGLKDKLSDV